MLQIDSMCQFVNHCVHLNQDRLGILGWSNEVFVVGIAGVGVSLVFLAVDWVLGRRQG